MNPNLLIRSSNKWSEFSYRLTSLDNKEKGDCFECLVECFLTIDPKYSTRLRHVWRLCDVPLPVRSKLNLPDLDEGIDLIAETAEGEFWAIQAKYRSNEEASLTRRQIATFTDLAFGICRNISFGLVCTTLDRHSRKIDLYVGRVGLCAGDVWRGLGEEFFKRAHSHLDGRIEPIEPYEPRPHQLHAVSSASEYFAAEDHARGKLIMPCGTGKTLTAFWIAQALGAKTILIAVPSLALVKQSLEVWAREGLAHGSDISWICICSDKTVSKLEREDSPLSLQDLGVQTYTNPKEIAAWFRSGRRTTIVAFTTYQSGPALAEGAQSAGITFDLALFDEAHKTVGEKQSLFSHLLFDKNLIVDKRIFMTATERRYRGGRDEIISMDHHEMYGGTCELLTFKEALEADPPILCDYKIVTICVENSMVSKLISSNMLLKPDRWKGDEQFEVQTLLATVALRKAIDQYALNHAVSFHSSVKKARMFAETQSAFTQAFPEYSDIEAFHVSGRTPSATRSRHINQFASTSRALITNARCLTEGVDVPNIDCVLFADPKRSVVDIVQAVGRALRPSPGKNFACVVVPVLINSDELSDQAMPMRTFETVVTTLRALASNDGRIIEYLRNVTSGESVSREISPIDIVLPPGIEIDVDSFVEAVELRLFTRLAKLSWRPFEMAREFARSLELDNFSQWNQYLAEQMPQLPQRPPDIPTNPNMVYKEQGWSSWGDWLGTGRVATSRRQFLPFGAARDFARSLGLSSQNEWSLYCQGKLKGMKARPEDIPTNPHRTYKDCGWISYGDWLGTGSIHTSEWEFLPFSEARKFVRSQGMKSSSDFKRWVKSARPRGIPSNPQRTYKDKGWAGWDDFLGTNTVAPHLREYRSFDKARSYAHSLNLKSRDEWIAFCKGDIPEKGELPDDIPAYPARVYERQGWKGVGDWLGTGTVAPRLREYREFNEARTFVRALGLRTRDDWNTFCRGDGNLPADIPKTPWVVYKTTGWKNLKDWLGVDADSGSS